MAKVWFGSIFLALLMVFHVGCRKDYAIETSSISVDLQSPIILDGPGDDGGADDAGDDDEIGAEMLSCDYPIGDMSILTVGALGVGNAIDLADVSSIVVHIREVGLKQSSGRPISLENLDYTIDLLAFHNGGQQIELGNHTVPDGSYSEVRLVIDCAQIEFFDGSIHPLKIPSGDTSGFKIQLRQNLVAFEGNHSLVNITIDLEGGIHLAGKNYMLRPSFKAETL